MHPTRRQLIGAGALLLTGCTSQPAPAPPPVDRDDALRAAGAAREQVLLRAYDAAVLAAPSLAGRLTPLRAEHAEHLRALTGPAAPVPPSAGPPGDVPPGAGPSAPASPARPVPGAVLSGLVRAERAAAAGHAADVAAASRPLAGLLAALSASEASHPVALA